MRHLLLFIMIFLCINLESQREVMGDVRISGSAEFNNGGVRGQTLFPGNWLNASTTLVYINQGGGYINGTNNYGDLSKGEKFIVDKPYYIVGAFYIIGVLDGDQGAVNFNIWDFSGGEKNVIASKTLSVPYIKQNMPPDNQFYVEFDSPVLVTNDYLIGVEFSDIGNTSFSLVSTADGEGGRLDLVHEQWITGEWYSYLDALSWGLDLDLGIFPSIEDVTISDAFEGGSGTLSDPYIVRTAEQLNEVRNFLTSYFIQIADIDLENKLLTQENGWLPIGSAQAPFTGNYNGNGYTINNMKISRIQSDYQGLFGYIKDGSVQNLKLTSAHVVANRYVGTLAGYCDRSSITHVSSSGYISGRDFIGGIIGYAGYSTLLKLNSHAEVRAQNYTGGLIGFLSGESQLKESYSYGHVEGNEQTGGLIGMVAGQSSHSVTSPNGVTAVIPHQISEVDHDLTLTDYGANSILRTGEKQASPVVKIGLSGKGIISGESKDGEGFPVYEIRFPITIQNAEENRLRVRVKMRDDTRLPVFGNYDKENKTYTIFTYGLVNNWIMGVVSGDPVTKSNIQHNAPIEVRNTLGWTTFDFEIIDDSDLSLLASPIKKVDIEENILPIARDVLINYHAAGFKPPKLYTDANKNAFKLHLINTDQPAHNAISGSSYYYSPDGINLLGGIYIFYKPNYIPDPQQPSTWKLDYVISHEIFHAIQSGYGYTSDNVKSSFFNGDASIATCYEEGTATITGGTYSKHRNVGDGMVSVHPDESFMSLSYAYDDFNVNPYSKQDFFAFLSKRYFNGGLEFLGPMWQDIADSWKNDYTKLLPFYREGLDKFLNSKGKTLTRAYTDFAMQRLYIHDPEYLLRDQSEEDPSPNNWFAKNFLTSFLLEDGKTYKKWYSSNETIYDYDPIKVESLKSLTSASIVMKMPDMISEENIIDSLELKLSLSSNVNLNQNLDEEGIRVVIIRANSESGNPVENSPSVVLKDISKPFKISLKDGVTHLVFIVINAYTQFTNTDIIIEQKKEKEFTAVRIYFEGDHNWEIAGDYFPPLPDPRKIEFIGGSSDLPDDDLKWTVHEFVYENNFYLLFFYSKFKVAGRLSPDKKKIEYIEYYAESNINKYEKSIIKIENINFSKELTNGIEFQHSGVDVQQKILEIEYLEYPLEVGYPAESNFRKYISTEFNENTKIRIQFLY